MWRKLENINRALAFRLDLARLKFANNIVDRTSKPFFIISSGRSGTTLLRRILQSHPAIHIPPESDDLIPATARVLLAGRQRKWEPTVNEIIHKIQGMPCMKFWNLDFHELKLNLQQLDKTKRSCGFIISEIYRTHGLVHKTESLKWGDKTPYLVNFLPWLGIIFPNAKFVFVLRDGRAVVNSAMKRQGYPIERAVKRWKSSIQQMSNFQMTSKCPIHVLKYEKLVSHPEVQLEQLSNFLEINYCLIDLNLRVNNLGDDALSHHVNVHKDINYELALSWKKELSVQQLAYIERHLLGELIQLGY